MVERPDHEGAQPHPEDGRPGSGTDIRISDTGRVEAFSDGVFAIVITLLVLELTSPEHEPGGLLAGLLHQWPSYVAFLLSFLYIGVLWLNHHALFRRIGRMDAPLRWINLAILLGVVIIPFPTAVLADTFAEGHSVRDERVAVTLYALAAAVMSAPWWVVFTYLRDHPYLLEPGTSPAYFHAQRVRPLTGLVLYGICGLTGWFISPVVGLACIAIMIIYHAVTSEGLREGPLSRLSGGRRA
ncbi:TMEM175 family protein [Streptomyces pathocidini]|uniref:TMEM175 family protein n=1 Tax=Streptomyces pathocidini TaxID=1650571 RepID=UPI0033CC6E1E